MVSIRVVAIGFSTLFAIGPVHAQSAIFSAESWCNDSGTLCWADGSAQRSLNGVRFIGEPNLGTVIQGDDNRFESKLLNGLIQAGIEVNAFEGFVSLQATLIPPGSIQLDEDSPLVTSGRLADPERRMKVDIGGTFGISLLDGILALGYGHLRYDTRRIPDVQESEQGAGFWYVQLQPLSAIRVAIKRNKSNPALR